MAVVIQKAIVKTAGNHRKLNGKALEVIGIKGRIITCKTVDTETGSEVEVGFSLSEIQELISDK
jgi:hypothetical protein